MNVVTLKALSHNVFNKICFFFYNRVHCSLFGISTVPFTEPFSLQLFLSPSRVLLAHLRCGASHAAVPQGFHPSLFSVSLPPWVGSCPHVASTTAYTLMTPKSRFPVQTTLSLSLSVSLADTEHMYPSACWTSAV